MFLFYSLNHSGIRWRDVESLSLATRAEVEEQEQLARARQQQLDMNALANSQKSRKRARYQDFDEIADLRRSGRSGKRRKYGANDLEERYQMRTQMMSAISEGSNIQQI